MCALFIAHQPGNFYRNVLNAEEKDRLCRNIAGHLKNAVDFIQERAVSTSVCVCGVCVCVCVCVSVCVCVCMGVHLLFAYLHVVLNIYIEILMCYSDQELQSS